MIALLARHWRFVAVAALVAAGLAWHHAAVSAAYRAGGDAVRSAIEASNREALEKAEKAARDLDACPPGKWDRRAGKCEP